MSQDCGWTNQHQWFRYRAAAIIVEEGMVLFAKTDKEDYYYSVGGAVHLGETAKHACLREVFEETGVHYAIDHLAIIHESFFSGTSGTTKGLDCHEITFYFLMKPRQSRHLHSHSFASDGIEEKMCWLPIEKLDQYTTYPSFIKDYLSRPHDGVEHIVTDTRETKRADAEIQ